MKVQTSITYPQFLTPFNKQVWDTSIPDKLVTHLNPSGYPTWTSSLETRIKASPNSFPTQPKDWIKCIDPTKIHDCTILWATESNAFTCSYVYHNYVGVNLGGTYFTGAIPIVETQAAKGRFLCIAFADE